MNSGEKVKQKVLGSSRNSDGTLQPFASAQISKPAESVLKIAHEHDNDKNNNQIRESFENKILSDLNQPEETQRKKSMSFHNSLPFLEMKKSFEAKAMKNTLANQQSEEESPLLNVKSKAKKHLNLSSQGSKLNSNRSILGQNEQSANGQYMRKSLTMLNPNNKKKRSASKYLQRGKSLGPDMKAPMFDGSPNGIQARKKLGLQIEASQDQNTPSRAQHKQDLQKYLSQSTSQKNKSESAKLSIVMNKEEIKSPPQRDSKAQITGLGNQNSAQILTKNEKDAIQYKPQRDSMPNTSDQESVKGRKINVMHFESPKNGYNRNFQNVPQGSGSIISNVDNAATDLQKSGSNVDSTINPMESPDILSRTKSKFEENQNMTGLRLRTNRISEVPNENSDTDHHEQSRKDQARSLSNGVDSLYGSAVTTPGIHLSFANKFRRATVTNNDITQSMDRFNNLISIYGKDNVSKEVTLLKKQNRDEKAKFAKQKAILEQQVELLTIQLHEASEREKSIKKTYKTMIDALQLKQQSSSNSRYKIDNDSMLGDGIGKSQSQVQGTSPPIIENYQSPTKRTPDISASASHHRSKSSNVIKERQFIRNSPIFTQISNSMTKKNDALQKKNEELQKQISKLQENIQTSTLQIKTQESLLIQKEDQIIALKRQQMIVDDPKARKAELQQIEAKSQLELQKKLAKQTQQMEEAMQQKLYEVQEKERQLNDKFIDLQKDVQELREELDQQVQIVHQKGLRCLELEKQIYLYEHKLNGMTKENERLKDEIDKLNEQDRNIKLNELRKDASLADIEEEDIDGKFVTSPNDSLNHIPEGERNGNNDYSFGDAERISMLNREHENNSPINLEIQKINKERYQPPSSSALSMTSNGLEVQLTPNRNSKSPKLQILKAKKDSKLDDVSKRSSSKLSKRQVSKSPLEQQPQSQPYKVQYWFKDEKFVDDGTCSEATCNALRRHVSDLRSQLTKLQVQYNDLKSSSLKEIARLKKMIQTEKKKRLNVQEDKLEKSSQLMQELVNRDQKIVQMQSQIHDIRDDQIELESLSRTYFGVGDGLGGLREPGFDASSSVYQSQQLYGTKGSLAQSSSRLSKQKRGSVMSSASQKSLGSQNNRLQLSQSKKSPLKSSRRGSVSKKKNESGLNRYLSESNPIKKKSMPIAEMFDNDESSSGVYGQLGNKTQNDKVYSNNHSLGEQKFSVTMNYQNSDELQYKMKPKTPGGPLANKIFTFQDNEIEKSTQKKQSMPLVINSPTNNQNRMLTMKSLDSTQFNKFQLNKHTSQQPFRKQIEQLRNQNSDINDLIETHQVNPSGCGPSGGFPGCNLGCDNQEEFRSSGPLPTRNQHQNFIEESNEDQIQFFYKDQPLDPNEMANTERNFNILSDGEIVEQSSINQRGIGLSESQGDLQFNAGLFSPLSVSKSNRKDEQKSKMLHATSEIQQKHTSNTLIGLAKNNFQKKKQSLSQSDSDCNVDENVGQEKDMNVNDLPRGSFQDQLNFQGLIQKNEQQRLMSARKNANSQNKQVPPIKLQQMTQLAISEVVNTQRNPTLYNPLASNPSFQQLRSPGKLNQNNQSIHESNRGSFNRNNVSAFNYSTHSNQNDISQQMRNTPNPTINQRIMDNQSPSIMNQRPLYAIRTNLTPQNQLNPPGSKIQMPASSQKASIADRNKDLTPVRNHYNPTLNSMSLKNLFNQQNSQPISQRVTPLDDQNKSKNMYNPNPSSRKGQHSKRGSVHSNASNGPSSQRGSIQMNQVFKPSQQQSNRFLQNRK